KLFLATAGISPDYNLTYPSFSDLVVKTAMIESADKVFLLADSSKIGVTTFASLGPITKVDALITDSKITQEAIDKLTELGVAVV
nr:alkaline phosphatase [Bacteroidaceae bacterium]